MKEDRTEYQLFITVNGLRIESVIIDSHYRHKHSSTINDELILELVRKLDEGMYVHVDAKHPFEYFVVDGIILQEKAYRLIWLLEEGQSYIGVINAFRSSK